MNLFALSGLLVAINSFSFGIFSWVKGKRFLNKIWAVFNLSVAIWGLGAYKFSATLDKSEVFFWLRLGHIGVVMMPVLFLHFVFELLEIKKIKLLYFIYGIGVFFSILNLTDWIGITKLFIVNLRHVFNSFYVDSPPGLLYPFFVFFFFLAVIYAHYLGFKSFKVSTGLKRLQIKYFLFATAIGFTGGGTAFLMVFNMDVYPFLHFAVAAYPIVMTYAILKHRLMDINIALTRAGIFVFVYTLVLGIPFGLAGWGREWLMSIWNQNWFWAPMLVLLVLATSGPFIYQRLRKQAEDIILKDQKAYQNALLETSSKMLLIKELLRLLETAGSTVMKTVKVSFVGMYVEDEKTKKYTCRYKQAREGECGLPEEFAAESELAQHLSANKLPIIGEETSSSGCKIGLAAPFMVNDVLLGFMLLGEKDQTRAYTQDDVNVFTILANQIAMAIENCQFYAQEKERQALLYQSATLAQMGVMADSMGHQIKNHIQKMTMQSGSLAGLIEEFLGDGITMERAEQLLRRTVDMLHKIEKQGETGGRLIESISKFSKLPRGEFKQTTIAEMFATANDMLRFKIKFERIDYVVDIADNLPQIYAHPILGEAFFNLIDNAYDTVMDREERLKEQGYRGRIVFQARCGDSTNVEIKIADNGMGVDDRIFQHLFLPFYTTKATANKGTGLGLFVIKQIVDNHKGSITIDSKRLKGTTFTILLPLKADR